MSAAIKDNEELMRRGGADLIGDVVLMGLHRPGRRALLRFSWAGQSRKVKFPLQDGQFELSCCLKVDNNPQNMIKGCGCLAFRTNCKYKN